MIAAIDVIENEPELRKRLWGNIRLIRNGLTTMGFDVGDTESAIIPVIIQDDMKTFDFTRILDKMGIFVSPVVSS